MYNALWKLISELIVLGHTVLRLPYGTTKPCECTWS